MVCALQNVLNGVSYNILKYICAVLFAAAINRKKRTSADHMRFNKSNDDPVVNIFGSNYYWKASPTSHDFLNGTQKLCCSPWSDDCFSYKVSLFKHFSQPNKATNWHLGCANVTKDDVRPPLLHCFRNLMQCRLVIACSISDGKVAQNSAAEIAPLPKKT